MTTFTVTLPNGTIAKRRTERTYTHVVVVEREALDGTIRFGKPEWASRLDLAQKNAVKREKSEAGYIAQQDRLPESWTRMARFAVHILPVNA